MSDKRLFYILLFVLGLVLISIGTGLLTITVSRTAIRYYNGFPVPYQEIVNPYVGAGVILALVGFGVMVSGLFGIMAYGLYGTRANVGT